MHTRVLLAVTALLMTVSALLGTQFSGATFTRQHQAPAQVHAKDDWAPPTVSVDRLPFPVSGSQTVTATASDDRSSIASVRVEYSLSSPRSWTPLSTCTGTGDMTVVRTCTWDTTSVADGDYLVRVVATDTAGYTGTSASVAASVANADNALVLQPVAAVVGGTVTVTGGYFNLSSNGASTLRLEYRTTGTGPWQELNGSCHGGNHDRTVSCGWGTNDAVSDGTYDLRVTNGSSEDIQIGIVVDNTAPTGVRLTAPTGPLYGTATLEAVAADSSAGIDSVKFQYKLHTDASWSLCGTDTTSQYSCDLDTIGLTSGAMYDFRVVATDRAGNATTTTPVSRTVDNSPASVAITSPAAGVAVDGVVPVGVSASAPSGVAGVVVQVRPHGSGAYEQVCVDTSPPYLCNWDTSGLTGNVDLRAVMTKGAGGTVTSGVVTVSVDHSLGAVSISEPASGTTLTGAGPFAISGTTSTGHGVQSVVLHAAPVNPSGSTTSTTCSTGSGTFTCTWAPGLLAHREFDLSVEMTQANGVTVDSVTPVHVTIANLDVTLVLSPSPTPTPAAGYVNGSEQVTAHVDAQVPVASVALEYRASPSGSWQPVCAPITLPPFVCGWDTTTVSNGAYDVRATAYLSNGGSRSDLRSITVANLRGVEVSAGNKDGTPGSGDTLTFTYSTKIDFDTIKQGFTGAATPVTIRVTGNGDLMQFSGARLGTVDFAQDYFKDQKNPTVTGQMTASDASGVTVVTVTLPSFSNGDLESTGGVGRMVWTPDAGALDIYLRGNCLATPVTETDDDADL